LGHYLPGGQFTVFELPAFRFSTTICWENVFADVVRQFVRQGAECIINITNEGHFGKTAAPYQLTAISVFRAVENRIFIVRCGNTGVSCVIDPYGRILDRVKNDQGEDIFIRGILKTEIVPLKSETIYTRFGEIAVWVGFLGSFIILLPVIYRPI
jgi:apolipoprotein N-acyltransferase